MPSNLIDWLVTVMLVLYNQSFKSIFYRTFIIILSTKYSPYKIEKADDTIKIIILWLNSFI